MNIKEYISSGIVESYVLGLALPEERTEFEQLEKEHKEIAAARQNFELALEQKLRSMALAPPADIKQKLFDTIRNTSGGDSPKIIRMDSPVATSRASGLRAVAAASVILLLVSAFFAYRFYTQNKELTESNKELQAKINTIDSAMNKMEEDQRMISDPNVAVVNLTGTEKAPQSSANVYWDTTTSNVYLVIKNMPKLPTEQQYQLWALIDGKPADLGLFDGDKEKVILKMKNTQKAQAFAITIETRGNTGGPTMENLQSMGKPSL